MIIIDSWSGRLGNNVLQLVRAIHYASVRGYSHVHFPRHDIFTSTDIAVSHSSGVQIPQRDSFFSLKKFNITDPEPYHMRSIFQTYIKPIMCISFSCTPMPDNILFMHVRSGDTFSLYPHSAYVPAPLYFYTTAMKSFQNGVLVYEDMQNPCVEYLHRDSRVVTQSSSLTQDIQTLMKARHLAMGFGTFGFLIYLMNMNLKTLYIPKYVMDELPAGSWGDITLHIVDLPNYTAVGDWKNTPEQYTLITTFMV